jgi:hypothetical protein
MNLSHAPPEKQQCNDGSRDAEQRDFHSGFGSLSYLFGEPEIKLSIFVEW